MGFISKPDSEKTLSTSAMGSLIIFGCTQKTRGVIDSLLEKGYKERNIRVYDYDNSNALDDEKYRNIELHKFTQLELIEMDFLTYTVVGTNEKARYESDKFQQQVHNNKERRKEIRRTQRELKKSGNYLEANEMDTEFNSLRYQHNSWQPVTTRKVYHKILLDLDEMQMTPEVFEAFIGRPKDAKAEVGEWMKDYLDNRDNINVRKYKNIYSIKNDSEVEVVTNILSGL